MNKITKAVFPVAGLGTRFLPATKASPKEMLPIVDKPLIQYAAEEAIAAGFGIEPRDRAMRGVGLNLGQPRPPRVIKFVHQRGIANERLGRRDILDPMPLP